MTQKVCPECKGEKKVAGNCVCNMEWSGNKTEEGLDDCQCEPEKICPFCGGTGVVELG